MWAYLLRRVLLMVPTVLGVLLLTFVLFGMVNRNPARVFAGKQATADTVRAIEVKMGLDKPKFVNVAAMRERGAAGLFDSQFVDLALMRFPVSMRFERPVWEILLEKAPVSLAIQLPAFAITVGAQLAVALVVAARRGSRLDAGVTALCVVSMALPALSMYLLLQWLLAVKVPVFPVAGWEPGWYAVQYAALPILCSVAIQLGWGVRFYRSVILEEVGQDYVRTARSKGVSQADTYLVHILRNVMIPVVTQTVTALPGLVFGALILERVFQIPGLGGLLVDSIEAQDRSVVMAVTYVTALMYCGALLVSDILYTLADPRVSLRSS